MAFLTGYASISRRAMTGTIPRIARSHPLANGLIAAFYPAVFPGGTMVNLASPGILDLTTRHNAASFNTNTPEGPGFNGTTNGGQVNTSGLPALFVSSAPLQLSLFVRGLWGTQNATNSPAQIFGFYTNTTNFPQVALNSGPNFAGANTPGAVGISYPTSTTVTHNPCGTLVPTVGSMVSIGGSFLAGVTPSLYANGALQTIPDSPGVMTITSAYWNANGQFTLNEFQSSTRNATMVTTVAYAWNRVLSAAEHMDLSANPYALLRWPIDVVYDILEQPAGAPPVGTATSKAMILAPLTVGLGGAAAVERWLRRRKDTIRRLRGE